MGFGAQAAVVVDHLRVGVLGTYFPHQRTSPPGGVGGGDFTLAFGALRGCYLPWRMGLMPAFCLQTELGALSGEAVNVSSPGHAESLWFAAGGGIHLAWRATSTVALTGGGDVLAVLSRDEFAIAGIGTIHRPPELTARASVGVEFGFR